MDLTTFVARLAAPHVRAGLSLDAAIDLACAEYRALLADRRDMMTNPARAEERAAYVSAATSAVWHAVNGVEAAS